MSINDEITIKDEDEFELCSDDDIQDVLPDQQKTMKVTLKGMGLSQISIPPTIVQQVSSSVPQNLNPPVVVAQVNPTPVNSIPQSIAASVLNND